MSESIQAADKAQMRTVYLLTAVAALGGLLFGYDTAVISGAIGFLKIKFQLSAAMTGWAASSAIFGCIFGAMAAGWLSDIEIQVEHTPWQLKGAMDGMLSDGSGFELKTVNYRKFAKILKDNAPLEEHLMQVHAYMRALNLTHFSIVYENRDSANWKEFRVPRMSYIDEKLDSLMNNLDFHIGAKTLPFILESCMVQKGTSWTYCDWKDVCPTAQWKENNV